MDDVEKIAKGLTAAQRVLLLTAHETFIMGRMKLALRSKALREAGLAVMAMRGGDLLTPLGEQVRSYLKGSRDD
jgi:hypothetical protein